MLYIFDKIELLDDYFQTMTFSNIVRQPSADNNFAVVSVTLNAVDIFTVIQGFVYSVTEMVEAEGKSIEDLSDAELDKMLRDTLKAPDAPQGEITFDIVLKLDPRGKKWIIVINDILRAGLFMQDISGEMSGGSDFEIVETVETQAKYISGDSSMGDCRFLVEGQEIDMFCHSGHADILEREYKNQELVILYQVVARVQSFTDGELDEVLFVLLDIVR